MREKQKFANKVTELVDKLPLFPRDIDKLLAIAVKPSEDITEILQLIESDPRLSSELLRLAKVYYGKSEDIRTAEDAVHHVGAQAIVQLIGISYARNAIEAEFSSLKYLNEYLDHSEEISIGCRILAEISRKEGEECGIYAVAGLIHDIGRLAIMVASNRTSSHVLGTLWDKMASVVHDEKANLGTNHCEVGAQICRKWNFSPIIQEGVLRHHTPLIDSNFSIPGAIIFTSHFLSASDPSGDILSTLSAGEVVGRLKISASDFDRARELYRARTEDRSLMSSG
ncbi:MAG: HDOD domain-containing protein [Planctomycetota bacterium]|nr:MAG: HDOD domain-containing protein [Planctomycetota bacterium]